MMGILKLRKIFLLPATEGEEEARSSSPLIIIQIPENSHGECQAITQQQEAEEAEGYHTIIQVALTSLASTIQHIHGN